jgi:hypothetical protein
VSILEQPAEPSPLSRLFVFISAVALAIVTLVGTVASWVAARWRGILLTHIFFLTLWLAIQVFLYAKEAFAYLSEKVPNLAIQVPHLPAPPGLDLLPKIPSTKSVTTCWRNRSLGGDCFARVESRRAEPDRTEPPRKPPPPRVRPHEPPAFFPCRRFYYNCRADDI